MREAYIPLIVNTLEALTSTVKNQYGVVYIENVLYLEMPDHIEAIMKTNGYKHTGQVGRSGVFFIKTTGPQAYDPCLHKIHDPLNIL